MLRYANVGRGKSLPFPKGRGTCPCCNGALIANCGKINTHHWAHEKKEDCDAWSEPIGPWHLWWQNLVRSEFVEVPKGCHRADIVGNGGVVVELQHSSISADDIAAREAHYGDMVWLFDATDRFVYLRSGVRAFFSLGQTKHLDRCVKPVYLDFGIDVVQVDQFSDAITLVSGFGTLRSRKWFAQHFLSDVRRPKTAAGDEIEPAGRWSDPWARKSPVRKLKHDTRWIDPASGGVVTFPKWTEYIKVNYYIPAIGSNQHKQWDHDMLIGRHPDVANGWTIEGLAQMKDFLNGTAVIIDGLLRVLPAPADSIRVDRSVRSTERFLGIAQRHIHAGRLPVLKESTKVGLLQKAKQYEIETFGRIAESEAPQPCQLSIKQSLLFE